MEEAQSPSIPEKLRVQEPEIIPIETFRKTFPSLISNLRTCYHKDRVFRVIPEDMRRSHSSRHMSK